MPMPISNLDEYDKVINVSWFTPDKAREELKSVKYTRNKYKLLTMTSFPCVLPFSQMYPLCCIDIRNFLNQFYFFSDDHFLHPNVIDETLKKVYSMLSSLCQTLTLVIVFGPTTLRESLQVTGRKIKLSIFRTNCPNPHQP
jgi:hypothetical protein